MDIKTVRAVLIWVILLTGMADLGTFLFYRQYHAFEINPIYLASHSVLLLAALKAIVLAAVCVTVWFGWGTRYTQYMMVLGSLYIIMFQGLGAYSNIQVAASNPGPDQVYAPAEATHIYMSAAVWSYLFPLFLASFAYFIFDKAGYDNRLKVTKLKLERTITEVSK
jgi:hypothetical protein